ncbi:MAG: PhzF family phenazine biosynthesis protein [Alsobacter sp.]
MPRHFYTLDVFTDRALAGNPLAVVLDAQGLTDVAMQAIAREFNLSETVFVLPPADPHQRASLRIFTPARELPFAGHPTVGTAVLLGCLDHGKHHGVTAFGLEEKVGLVPCAVEVSGDGRGTATFTLPRLPEEVQPAAPREAVAAALGLSPRQIGFENHVPTIYTAGNAVCFVPVIDGPAIAQARPQLDRWEAGIWPRERGAAYLYTRDVTDVGSAFHARLFSPLYGIPEDPATGSAVAAMAGLIMAFDKPEDGEHSLVVEQGYEMGRPSRITLGLTVQDGALTRATISGSAVVVSEGSLRL